MKISHQSKIALTLLLLISFSAAAQTNDWIGAGTGGDTSTTGPTTLWSQSANWSLSHLPTGSEEALVDFANSGSVNIDCDAVADDVSLTNNALLRITNDLYSLTAYDQFINYDALLEQTAGTNSSSRLSLGSESSSNGSYNLSGTGVLSAGKQYIGYLGTGTFAQSGGTNSVSDLLSLAYEPGSNGTYTLSGGILNVSGNIIGGDGSSTFSLDGGTLNLTGNFSSIDYLYIGENSTASYAQTAGTNSVNRYLYLGYISGSDGTYTLSGTGQLSAEREYIGYDGNGTFTQTAGTNSISSYLYLGHYFDSNGTYTLSGTGQLSANHEYIGCFGTGTFTQTAGTNSIIYSLFLGWHSGSNGTYQLSGTGQLSAYNEYIGYQGTGTFTQTAGTNSISSHLYLGRLPDSNGTYTLSGTGQLSADNQYIGLEGTGTFNQTGGTNSINNDLHLGYYSTSNGTYTLSGGTLDVTGDIIGGSGNSTFSLDGGTLNLTGNFSSVDTLYVGENSTASYTQNAGINSINDGLYLGYYFGANGTYELSGAGHLSANNEFIAYEGTGTFTQTAGINSVYNKLHLAYKPGSNGTYELSGTGQLSADIEYIGEYGTGTFNQTGGTNSAYTQFIGYEGTGIYTQNAGTNSINDNLYLGTYSNSIGTYTLSGTGQLSADNEFIGRYGTGTFTQTGGTNTSTNLTIGELGEYNISNGSLTTANLYVGTSSLTIGNPTLNITDHHANITVSNSLYLGPTAVLNAVPGSTIHMTGSAFEIESTDTSNLTDLANLTLIFEGGQTDIDPFEIACQDMGQSMSGFYDNFALGTLTLGGADIGMLQLTDLFDNRPDYSGDEALYVNTLNLSHHSYLDLNGFNIYCLNFTDLGATINLNGGSITQMLLGDYNTDGTVDQADYTIWADSYGNTGTGLLADGNGDRTIDQADYTIWADNYGSTLPTTPPNPVPEPTTLSFFFISLLLFGKNTYNNI